MEIVRVTDKLDVGINDALMGRRCGVAIRKADDGVPFGSLQQLW